MCRWRSAWLKRDGDLLLAESDSHGEILEIYGIEDRNGRLADLMVPVEFCPPNDGKFYDVADYVFSFHETPRPDWATDEMIAYATERLRDIVDRAIVREDRQILCGGRWIVAPGVTVKRATVGTVVIANYGTVAANYGTVARNCSGGTVARNYSSGTVTENRSGGTVAENYGAVARNYGAVTANYCIVAANCSGGAVARNYSGGTVAENYGTVDRNYGAVTEV